MKARKEFGNNLGSLKGSRRSRRSRRWETSRRDESWFRMPAVSDFFTDSKLSWRNRIAFAIPDQTAGPALAGGLGRGGRSRTGWSTHGVGS